MKQKTPAQTTQSGFTTRATLRPTYAGKRINRVIRVVLEVCGCSNSSASHDRQDGQGIPRSFPSILFVIFRGAGTAHRNRIAKGCASLLRSLSSAFRVRCCRCCVGGCGSRLEIADFTVFSTRFSFYGLTGQNGLPAIWQGQPPRKAQKSFRKFIICRFMTIEGGTNKYSAWPVKVG